jgi:hypothetical protein
MPDNNKNLVVFGFDAGDGEFSVYFTLPDAPNPSPVSVFNPETQLSGYIKLDTNEIIYGDSLFSIDYNNFKHVGEFNINFKSTPGTKNDEKIKEFASIVFNAVKKLVPQYFKDNYTQRWFVGCPSGWKNNEVKNSYADIFRSAEIPNVQIVYESNAALSYYDKELSVVNIKNVENGVLLLDYGSSTLDATFIRPNEETSPYGCALGASYIEKAMLHFVLTGYRRYDKNEEYNDHALLERVKKQHEEDEAFKNWLLLQTRKLKETYFKTHMNSIGFSSKAPTISNFNLPKEIEWGVKRPNLTLFVDPAMMNEIINSPIKDVVPGFNKMSEFTIKDIGNESWLSRNNRFLKLVSEQHPQYVKTKSLLVLTGGASQMDFVRDSVVRHFPNSIVSFDTNPSTTIAQGLTYWGPAAIKAEKFDEAFDKILDMPHRDEKGSIELDSDGDPVSEILHIIFKGYELLVDETLLAIATQEKTSLNHAIDKWFDGDIQCENITKTAAAHFENWMKKEMPTIFNKGIKNCTEHVKKKINELFKELYLKNGLFIELFSAKDMELSLTQLIMEFFENKCKTTLIDEINSLKEAFSKWGNGLKIWRSTKVNRNDSHNTVHELAQSTYDWLIKIFYSQEILEAVIYDNFITIKADLESKKESAIYKLGLAK